MEITEFLARDSVCAGLAANSKRQLLLLMSELAAGVIGISAREIFLILKEREQLGSTGLEKGVAIPHGKLPSLDRLYGFFASLEHPVAFDAVDGQPVDLVFLLLGPASAGADYLKTLARVSRMLRDSELIKKLRTCEESAALYALLTEPAASHAA